MQYSSTTPYIPDIDHVIAVIGKERFAANLGKPVTDWGLTDDECARIKRGPHGEKRVYILDSEWYGQSFSDWVVECECGLEFPNRLLSRALDAHDRHAGVAAVSHVHTRELLES